MQTENIAFQYTDRGRVLHHLAVLMRRVLSANERRALLLHCGVGVEYPQQFDQIALQLALPSPQAAQASCQAAVQKTRAAIPGSRLERYLARYTPL